MLFSKFYIIKRFKRSNSKLPFRNQQTYKNNCSPMMLAFSETESNPPEQRQEIMNLKINNFLHESDVRDFEDNPREKNKSYDNYEDQKEDFDEVDRIIKLKDKKEMEKLEKSGVLNWDGSDNR